MPTSHRGEKKRRPLSVRAVIIAALVVVAVAAIVYLLLGLATGSSDDVTGHAFGVSSATGRSSPAASGSSSPSSHASASKTTHPSSRKTDLPGVEATPPHALSIGTTITDAPFASAISPTGGHLVPDGLDALQRLGDRGIPGSPGTDTVVVVGATTASGEGVLAGIDDVKAGDTVVLESQNARLTYRVTSADRVAAMKVLSLPALTGKHTDRLVIDAAHYDGSERTGPDTVLVATLSKVESLG